MAVKPSREVCESGIGVTAEPAWWQHQRWRCHRLFITNKYGVSLLFTNVRHLRHRYFLFLVKNKCIKHSRHHILQIHDNSNQKTELLSQLSTNVHFLYDITFITKRTDQAQFCTVLDNHRCSQLTKIMDCKNGQLHINWIWFLLLFIKSNNSFSQKNLI